MPVATGNERAEEQWYHIMLGGEKKSRLGKKRLVRLTEEREAS